MTDILLLLSITLLAPFAGAVLAAISAGRVCRFFAILASVVALVASAIAVYAAYPGLKFPFEIGTLPWLSDQPLFGLSLDSLASVMLLGITSIGVLVVIYSTRYLSPENADHPFHDGTSRYFFWLLVFIGSMVGIALSPNLLQMFIFWEMTTLGSWALISHTQEEKALRAGFKALVMTHIGGLAFIVGLILVYLQAGTFSFDALGEMALGVRSGVFMLLLVAGWAKSAQLPLHTWLPDAMEAPTPVSAYLHAAAMVKAGVYLVARLLVSGFGLPTWLGVLVCVMGFLTMFMAVLAYFRQDDLKRLLAFSTIVHLSYIFVGLGLAVLGSTVAYRGAALHILCHGVAKATLFLSVGAIAYATGSRKISQLRGLATKLPLAGVAYIIGVLAATGVPPFSGFWSKYMIFVGALEAPYGWIALLLLVIESVISFAWLLWVGQKIFMGDPSETVQQTNNCCSFAINFALMVGIALCIAAPIFGIPLVNAIKP